jgi:hypothetical protein
VRSSPIIYLVTSLFVILCGCKEHRGTTAKRDACSLISKEEVASVQASPVNDIKGSERSDDVFRISQCFYATAESSQSVNLALVQSDPKQGSTRSPKDFWKEKFDPYQNEEPKTESGEEKEQGPAPKKIERLGDDAYWVANRFGGILYVLKGHSFISIGLGGTDDEETKLKKSKALAKEALQRL